MNIDQRLARLDERQEALVSTMNGFCDIMIQTRTMVGEMMAWLKQPRSNDLPEFLTRMSLAVEQNTAAGRSMEDAIRSLEDAIRK